MPESEDKEIVDQLAPAPDVVTISLVLNFIEKSDEDGKPKFVSTFYANNARYMEIASDQIHLTDRMKLIMGKLLRNEGCDKSNCKCGKEA